MAIGNIKIWLGLCGHFKVIPGRNFKTWRYLQILCQLILISYETSRVIWRWSKQIFILKVFGVSPFFMRLQIKLKSKQQSFVKSMIKYLSEKLLRIGKSDSEILYQRPDIFYINLDILVNLTEVVRLFK